MPYQVEKCTDFAGVIKCSDGSRFHVLAPGGTEELTKRIARLLNACEQFSDREVGSGLVPRALVNADPKGAPLVQTMIPPGEVRDLIANGHSPRDIAEAFFGLSVGEIENVVREIVDTPEDDDSRVVSENGTFSEEQRP